MSAEAQEQQIALALAKRLSVLSDGSESVLSPEQQERFRRARRRHAAMNRAVAAACGVAAPPYDMQASLASSDATLEAAREKKNVIKAAETAIAARQALLNPDLDITADVSGVMTNHSLALHSSPERTGSLSGMPSTTTTNTADRWSIDPAWLRSGEVPFIVDQVMTPAANDDEMEQYLTQQRWICRGCRNPIKKKSFSFVGSKFEARFCHYTGYYYCRTCHTNERRNVIPARALHAWDFEPQLVCDAAADYLELIHDKPVICVSAHRPELYSLSALISTCRHIRVQLALMHETGRTCSKFVSLFYQPPQEDHHSAAGDASPGTGRLPIYVPFDKRYLIEDSECWSLADLEGFHNTVPDLSAVTAPVGGDNSPARPRQGARLSPAEKSNNMFQYLCRVRSQMVRHIAQACPLICHRAAAKACGACTLDEVIFSFDVDNVATCPRCDTGFHRHCWETKLSNGGCPNCAAIADRARGQSFFGSP